MRKPGRQTSFILLIGARRGEIQRLSTWCCPFRHLMEPGGGDGYSKLDTWPIGQSIILDFLGTEWLEYIQVEITQDIIPAILSYTWLLPSI